MYTPGEWAGSSQGRRDCRKVVELLSRTKDQLIYEVHLAIPNGTSGLPRGDAVTD